MDAEAPDLRPADKPTFEVHLVTLDQFLIGKAIETLIFWLKDDSLAESANLPAPEIIAQEITDDLEAALEQLATIADDLQPEKS